MNFTNGLEYDSGYYDWQIKRIEFILKTLGTDFFNGKKILELACFKGGVSKIIHNLIKDTCGELTSVEGHLDNYNHCKKLYPEINFIHYDLDSPDVNEWIFYSHYDIIIHWGLLYHLQYPETSINKCLHHCDKLLLETLIVDSNTNCIHIPEKNTWGTDQSIHEVGSRFNTTFVENMFNHLKFKRYDNSELNSKNQPVYDWIPSNNGEIYRRFWVIETN